MNLREIIQECNTILDYNPDLASYRAQAARSVNRAYLETSGQYPWLFLRKTVTKDLYATVEGSTSATVDNDPSNTRKIVGTGTSFHVGMNGHVMRIGTSEYEIVRVVDSTNLYIDGSYSGSSTSDWEIRFDAYDLPNDVGEVLGFTDRENDRGPLTFVDAYKEEQIYLDSDESGTPKFVIEQPPEFTIAPNFGPRAAVSSGGSLTADHVYEYFYTIVEKGRESAPSKVVTGTTTSGNKTITISSMQSLDTSGGLYTGRQRRLYRRDQTENGRFLRIETATTGTSYTDTGSFTENDYDADYWDEAGMAQRIRFWHRPSADQEIEIRYQSIPKRLQADSDQPCWPRQYHHLIVYLAIQDLAVQHGANSIAEIYKSKAKDMLSRMQSRWLSRSARMFVRRGFDSRMVPGRDFFFNGAPVKS
jgi:hypothetical protein